MLQVHPSDRVANASIKLEMLLLDFFFARGKTLFFPDTTENYARLNLPTVCSPRSETRRREFPYYKTVLWIRPIWEYEIKAGPPPLEAILVIFGRRALIFFVWKLLEKMKNDATFVRMRSGDHLGDAKMSKKGTSLRRI